jgi:hypothetical protein
VRCYARLTSAFGGLLLAFSSWSANAACPVRSLGVASEVVGTQAVRTATASAEPLTSAPESIETAEDEADLAARALLLPLGHVRGAFSGVIRISTCFDGRFVYVTVLEDAKLARQARDLRARMPSGGR